MLAHNIRSTHNVGSIFRTCDGFGVSGIIFSGYTPYPLATEASRHFAQSLGLTSEDKRLPHIREKLQKDIHKTALGAEESVPFCYAAQPPLDMLRSHGYKIVALEQSAASVPLPTYRVSENTVLILGEEVRGIPEDVLQQCDAHVEIPMQGAKESFNVSVATGITLYQFTI